MTQQELNTIIKRHQHWLKEDCEGWKDMKANLSGADLRGVDLSGANLRGVDKYRLGQILKEPIPDTTVDSRKRKWRVDIHI